MIFQLFILLIAFTIAHDNCVNPNSIELNIEETLPFTAGMSETPIIFENQKESEAERIQANYCTFRNPYNQTRIFTIKTNPETSTTSTLIYLYSICDHEKAQGAYMISGYNYNPIRKMDFPEVTVTIEPEKSIVFAVALKEKFHNGNVKIRIVEYAEQTQSDTCGAATQVSIPYTNKQYFFTKTEKMSVECSNLNSPKINSNVNSYTLWYTFVGNGRKLKISTCDNFTNVDTKIAVVTSCPLTNGQRMICSAIGNNGCPLYKYATNMYLDAKAGTRYYIAVSANPDMNTNKIHEGQFALSIDYLDESKPTICENAQIVDSYPFNYSGVIGHDWPASVDLCYENGNDDRSIFFKVIGTGNDIVVSACDSYDEYYYPTGVVLEFLDSCSASATCLLTSKSVYKQENCGTNMYFMHNTERGREYTVRAYCSDDHIMNCPLTLNIYEKTDSHGKCEVAKIIQDKTSFTETLTYKQLQKSVHGCDGKPSGKNKGSWYKLKLSPKKTHQRFTVTVRTKSSDIGGWIELPEKCGSFNCEAGKNYGTIMIDINSANSEQLIYVYPEEGKETAGLIVEINEITIEKHKNCETTTKYVTLPFSIVDNFDSDEELLVCENFKTETSYFKFKLPTDEVIEATTFSDETKIKTGIEITSGCATSGGQCIAQAGDITKDKIMGVELTHQLQKDTDYVATVYSYTTKYMQVRQYRLILNTQDPPENSVCTQAIEIDTEAKKQHHSFYNKYAYSTTLGDEYGQRRGGYYHIEAKRAMTVVVNTCSAETSENSMIVISKDCSTKGIGQKQTSVISDITNVISSKIDRCGVYGTELSFNLKPSQERYIFIAAEKEGDIAFISLEINIYDNYGAFYSLTSQIALCAYGWAAFILLLFGIIYIVKKIKHSVKTKSYTAEAQKGYHLLDEHDDDEEVVVKNDNESGNIYIDEEKDDVELLEF